ncbi:MAG: hypothetical protein NVS2B16_19010 [Chloroflexota bacterium]
MRRASLGNGLNYLTTIGAQILFAKHFGSTSAAAAYTIVFGTMMAICGVLVSTVQSVVLPRLVDRNGQVAIGAVGLLVRLTAAGSVVAALSVAGAASLAQYLHRTTGIDVNLLTDLMRIGAVALFLQLLAGEAAAVALALGRRLLPAFAPAFPSLTVMSLLLLGNDVGVRAVYLAFAAGSVASLVVLLASTLSSVHIAPSAPCRVGTTMLLTMTSTLALAVVPPLERVVAATHSVADAAHYDYAIRALSSVQLIFINGLSLAGLGTWTALALRGHDDRLRRSLGLAVVVAAVSLAISAAVALVATQGLVSLVFQRGRFTPTDTRAVSDILVLALPGFWAQGVGVLLTSMLSATRHNRYLYGLGFANAGLRCFLIVVLGALMGVEGVAVAYSAASFVATFAIVLKLRQVSLLPQIELRVARKAALLIVAPIGLAVMFRVFGSSVPAPFRAAVVLAVATGIALPLLRRRREFSLS